MSNDPTKNPLEEIIKGLSHDIRNLDARMNERFSGVEGRLSTLEGKVSEMDGKLSGLGERLFSLENTVDQRLKETRPVWEAVQAQLTDLTGFVRKLDDKIDLQNHTILDLYSNQREIKRRLDRLEG